MQIVANFVQKRQQRARHCIFNLGELGPNRSGGGPVCPTQADGSFYRVDRFRSGSTPSQFQRGSRSIKGIGVSVAANLDQAISPAVPHEQFPFFGTGVVVDPPEIRRRIDRLDLADRPRRRLDQIEDGNPSSIIEWFTCEPECPARTVRPPRATSGREPAASKLGSRPFKEFETAGRDLETVKHPGMPATEENPIEVEIQQRSRIARHRAQSPTVNGISVRIASIKIAA